MDHGVALLCQKDTAQGTQRTLLGAFLAFRCFFIEASLHIKSLVKRAKPGYISNRTDILSFGSQLVISDLRLEDSGQVGCQAANNQSVSLRLAELRSDWLGQLSYDIKTQLLLTIMP